MADISNYITEQRPIVSVWVNEKGWLVSYNEKKILPWLQQSSYRWRQRKETEKEDFLDRLCVGWETRRKNRLNESFESFPMKSARKPSAEVQIPRTSLRRCIKNSGFRAYKPTPLNELSDRGIEEWNNACGNLLSAFPNLALRRNILLTDGCVVYSCSRSINVNL